MDNVRANFISSLNTKLILKLLPTFQIPAKLARAIIVPRVKHIESFN